MATNTVEISVKGRTREIPATYIDGKAIIVEGRFLKVAGIFDEEWQQEKSFENADQFVTKLKKHQVPADLFTFTETFYQTKPKSGCFIEWDNLAAISTASFKEWWERRISQDTRRNVRSAAKKGVIVKQVQFDAELVKGIQSIYNEAPLRQGRRFWHYGKDISTIQKENATYLDRSIFIGAYLTDELIGFIKMVVVNRTASIMQILSKNSHFNNRPGNALIAKAVEICEQRNLSHLIYCKYIYDEKEDSQLTEFKRRNGFERINYPRYFIPLTRIGKIALKLGLHRGIRALLPPSIVNFSLRMRKKALEYKLGDV